MDDIQPKKSVRKLPFVYRKKPPTTFHDFVWSDGYPPLSNTLPVVKITVHHRWGNVHHTTLPVSIRENIAASLRGRGLIERLIDEDVISPGILCRTCHVVRPTSSFVRNVCRNKTVVDGPTRKTVGWRLYHSCGLCSEKQAVKYSTKMVRTNSHHLKNNTRRKVCWGDCTYDDVTSVLTCGEALKKHVNSTGTDDALFASIAADPENFPF
jgi:hypothetical protein